jgi:hypothetical protein
MKILPTLACLTALATMTACSDNGYYDSRGNYHYDNGGYYNDAGNWSGETYYGNNYYTDMSARRGDSAKVIGYNRALDRDKIVYKRVGFYDYRGRYVTSAPRVAREYYPPRGMCRVWYADRPYDDQPDIVSCSGLVVPEDTYVIYGG